MSSYASDLLVSGRNRLDLRPREGWTQRWKRDDEVEESKDLGWVHIRKTVLDKDGKSTETGEVLKITEDKDTYLYAMEINEERWNRHQIAVARMSQERFDASLDGVHESIENANSVVGKKGGAVKGMVTNEQPAEVYETGRGRGRKAAGA